MDLKIIKVGYLQTNCYILTKDNNTLVIDPGDEGSKIIKYLKNNNLNMIGILITHHHEDHIGAIDTLLHYKKVDIYDVNNLEEGNHNISNFNFDVIYTFGHTNDSITYYFKEDKIMFVGDFIFLDGIGRVDLPTGNMDEMNKSISKIKTYNDDITVYPGHGDKTNLGYEKHNNYYFT